MKKLLLSSLAICLTIGVASSQTRYLDEIFTDVTVTPNVTFGENYYFIPDPTNPFINDLPMDVYEGTGDTETGRACVVVLHTGNFLPKYFNGSASGNNKDSSLVEACVSFAKRGYLVVAPNYRLGWDPLNADADVRRGTLLNAVYRGLNDAKACVRFMKSAASTYGIDADKIILYGEGSGGYLALAYAGLDRMEELEIEKFTDVNGDLYIDTALVGQIDGSGGAVNVYNNPGFSNDVMFAINAGGALGDSSWYEPGEAPICSFHVPTDPFAPFVHGIVIVPTTNENVVPVSGSRWVIAEANINGNNDVIRNQTFTDPYSLAAYAALQSSVMAGNPPAEVLQLDPADYEGLFPFIRAVPVPGGGGAIFPEAGPWGWWDEASVVATANAIGLDGQEIHDNGLLTNPDMSAAKGKAYIDSIMGYLAPRLNAAIISGVEETDFVNANTFVYPNPASDFLVVKTRENIRITDVEIFNITGALVLTNNGLNKLSHQIDVDGFVPGLYLIKVTTDQGIITRKAFVN